MRTSHPSKMPQEIQDVLNLTDTLIAILKEETRLIQQRNYKDAVDLQDQKAELLNEYARTISIMKEDPSLKANLGDYEKKHIQDKVEELHEMSVLNEITISAAYNTCQKIMVVVMDIAKKDLQGKAPYNRAGTFYKSETKAYSHSFGAVAVDRRF